MVCGNAGQVWVGWDGYSGFQCVITIFFRICFVRLILSLSFTSFPLTNYAHNLDSKCSFVATFQEEHSTIARISSKLLSLDTCFHKNWTTRLTRQRISYLEAHVLLCRLRNFISRHKRGPCSIHLRLLRLHFIAMILIRLI